MKKLLAWALVLVLQYTLCSAIPTEDQKNEDWKDNVGYPVPAEDQRDGTDLEDNVEYPTADNQDIYKATQDSHRPDHYLHNQVDMVQEIVGTVNQEPSVKNNEDIKVVAIDAIKQDSDIHKGDMGMTAEDGSGVKDPVQDEVVAEYGYGEEPVPDYHSMVYIIQELSNLKEAFQDQKEAFQDHISIYQGQVEENTNLKIEVENLQNEVKSLRSSQRTVASASSVAIDSKNGTHQNGTIGEGMESDWFGNSDASDGAVYTRWGRNDCPSTASKVYDGLLAGTRYDHTGGGANYLCLPKTPKYSTTTGSGQWHNNRAHVYGVDYEITDFPPFASLHEDDPPCAVCQSTARSNIIMIPARNDCPSGWTREYYGYLMSSSWNESKKEFVCVDVNAQPRPGTAGEGSMGNLYQVEGQCSASGGGLLCGPYVSRKEFTCAVCSK